MGKVEIRYVKAGSSEEVSARLLEASKGCLRIAMDERGENWTSRELEKRAKDWQMRAVKHVAFLIGAADGHTPPCANSATTCFPWAATPCNMSWLWWCCWSKSTACIPCWPARRITGIDTR